jgi:hypothetical protein
MGDTHTEVTADGKRKAEDVADKSALQSYSIAP